MVGYDRPRALKYVMLRAHEGGYRESEGVRAQWMWPWLSDERVAEIIAKGDHVRVLRSRKFVDCFWRVPLPPQIVPGNQQLRLQDFHVNIMPPYDPANIEKHYQAIQKATDPILYLLKNRSS